MRRMIFLLFSALALNVAAQNRPPKLEPLPEPPPPPPGVTVETEPQVTIVKRGETKEEEFRMNGKLYMVKVTPANGPTYYLIDTAGNGNFVRQDPNASNLRVPMWVIGTF